MYGTLTRLQGTSLPLFRAYIQGRRPYFLSKEGFAFIGPYFFSKEGFAFIGPYFFSKEGFAFIEVFFSGPQVGWNQRTIR